MIGKKAIEGILKIIGPMLQRESDFIEVTWAGVAAKKKGMGEESKSYLFDGPNAPKKAPEKDEIFQNGTRQRLLSRNGIHGLIEYDDACGWSVIQYQGANLIVTDSFSELADQLNPPMDDDDDGDEDPKPL